MFLAPWKPKTTVSTVPFAPDSKNQGICNVFWPGPRKNTGIYAVFSMLQEDPFSCQGTKIIVNAIIFALGKQQKKQPKSAKKCPKPKRNF